MILKCHISTTIYDSELSLGTVQVLLIPSHPRSQKRSLLDTCLRSSAVFRNAMNSAWY